ncbi:hypothetical protein [Paenibacillus sp. J2TS4]|uniref:hypothetical protein n=1 Tax=Paenibacillus sp. J2TS4 TaxID=2807194 RepID=UPI001B1F2C7D|nr:hypothetical protein [Paenibacillus sp. J2TS4]GIP32395.1 hypothetical protein J2TS4_16050 [Paenibacillus sp. J2TS4]
MDKRKVIEAYQRGFITIKECAQILGIDSLEVMGMVSAPQGMDRPRSIPRQSLNG